MRRILQKFGICEDNETERDRFKTEMSLTLRETQATHRSATVSALIQEADEAASTIRRNARRHK